MKYFTFISILLFTMCNVVQRQPKMTFNQSEYTDSARTLINWVLTNDSLVNWPMIFDNTSKKYVFVDSTQRIVSNKYVIKDVHFKIDTIRRIDPDNLILTHKDTSFIYSVIRNIDSLTIQKKIPGVSLKTLEIIKSDKSKGQDYKTISLPLFTEDYQIAIIEINNICQPECGHGNRIVLKRINQKWAVIRNDMTWIN